MAQWKVAHARVCLHVCASEGGDAVAGAETVDRAVGSSAVSHRAAVGQCHQPGTFWMHRILRAIHCRHLGRLREDRAQARVGALRAKGITEGVPRRQIYGPPRQAEMGHEHAYAIAAAALRDQVDRALCGRKGEPSRPACSRAPLHGCPHALSAAPGRARTSRP